MKLTICGYTSFVFIVISFSFLAESDREHIYNQLKRDGFFQYHLFVCVFVLVRLFTMGVVKLPAVYYILYLQGKLKQWRYQVDGLLGVSFLQDFVMNLKIIFSLFKIKNKRRRHLPCKHQENTHPLTKSVNNYLGMAISFFVILTLCNFSCQLVVIAAKKWTKSYTSKLD